MEFIRQHGVATTLIFPLLDTASDNYALPSFVGGDIKYIIHSSAGWQAAANTSTLPVSIGSGYNALDLTTAELSPDQRRYPVAIVIVDQSAPKAWRDDSIIVRFDVPSQSRAKFAGAFTSTAGTTFRMLLWVEQDGVIISLSASATAMISVYEHGDGTPVFTATDGGTPRNTNQFFELTQNNPNFTADRVYYAVVTITDGSQIYSGVEVFPIFG